MKTCRAIVALLIGLAIAVAPPAAAWAAMRTNPAPAQAVVVIADDDGAAATAMTDCEKMVHAAGHDAQKASGKSDCPCCDKRSACPPDLCPFKIFKVFGLISAPATTHVMVSLHLLPGQPQRPPDWIDRPQPPPPRA